MRFRVLVFSVFAAAMLFSIVREWSVPVSCPRPEMFRTRSSRVNEAASSFCDGYLARIPSLLA